MKWLNEKRNISDLKPAKYNPRKWSEEQKDICIRLGNAVMPKMMYNIALCLRKNILEKHLQTQKTNI